jgi:DNA protecting protein DprA
MIFYTPIERLAVRLQHCPGVGPVALRTLLGRIRNSGLSPEAWLEQEDQTLHSRFGLKPPAILALRQNEASIEDLLEKLAAMAVKILIVGSESYPRRLEKLLGTTAPPLLCALGNLDLCDMPSVGFCGSRKASEKGLAVTQDCAAALSAEHVNVVSGYASGVDLAAHEAALAAGGTTTLVLAEGILHFRVKQPLRPYVSGNGSDRYLALSEFPPALAWRAHNAMTRNRTICGLSNALIVVESGLEGGTFEAGKTALELGEPLFCVEYAEPSPSAAGNPYFLAHGAHSLKRRRSGHPNLTHLLAAAREDVLLSANSREHSLLHEDPPE